jgi:hypothetical protein
MVLNDAAYECGLVRIAYQPIILPDRADLVAHTLLYIPEKRAQMCYNSAYVICVASACVSKYAYIVL